MSGSEEVQKGGGAHIPRHLRGGERGRSDPALFHGMVEVSQPEKGQPQGS